MNGSHRSYLIDRRRLSAMSVWLTAVMNWFYWQWLTAHVLCAVDNNTARSVWFPLLNCHSALICDVIEPGMPVVSTAIQRCLTNKNTTQDLMPETSAAMFLLIDVELIIFVTWPLLAILALLATGMVLTIFGKVIGRQIVGCWFKKSTLDCTNIRRIALKITVFDVFQ